MSQQNANRNPPRNDRFEDYVPVAERLERFYEKFPDGRVLTAIVEHNQEGGFVLMRAEVYRNPDDAQPAATGHAFEVRGESYVNKTSYIENCETGSVGRALALLGFEVKRGIASREEAQKAQRVESQAKPSNVASITRERVEGLPADFDAMVPEHRHETLNKMLSLLWEDMGGDSNKLRAYFIKEYKLEVRDGENPLDSLNLDTKKGLVAEWIKKRAAKEAKANKK